MHKKYWTSFAREFGESMHQNKDGGIIKERALVGMTAQFFSSESQNRRVLIHFLLYSYHNMHRKFTSLQVALRLTATYRLKMKVPKG